MEELAPQWGAWITENLLRGAPPADILAVLVDQGLTEAQARARIEAIDGSPILAGARRLLARSAGVEQAARLARSLSAQAPLEHDTLSEEAFHLGYLTAHRPVVLRGAAAGWPASRWTHHGLAQRLGQVEVEALVGRSDHARWWLQRDALRRRMPLAQLLSRCLEEVGDDLYAVGRNDLLAEPGLAPLVQELGLLPGCCGDPEPRLWIGPAGTCTPLHHDQNSAWLVQLEGRKRVWLASPLEPALLDTAEGVFNRADPTIPAAGEAAEIAWRSVVLQPTDAVFIPVGWWHRVVALDPSISVSLGRLRGQPAFTWYHPGR